MRSYFEGVNLKQAFIRLRYSAKNIKSRIIHHFRLSCPRLRASDAFFQSPDRFENPYGNGETPGHQKCGNRSYELP